jgi:hypothetical protein
MANSSMLTFPKNTAPACRKRVHTVASKGGTKFSRMREPQVVRSPLVARTSLMARGTPNRRPVSPRAKPASASRAWALAPSSSTVM